MLCALLDTDTLPPLNDSVSAHFGGIFDGCHGVFACVEVILASASTDIRAMLIIFAAGFTMFCPPALCILTVWRGFSLGFISAYLCTALSAGSIVLPGGPAAFLLFLAANGLLAAAFVHLSAQAVCFSHAYREICGRPRRIIRSPLLWQYLFRYLSMFGFVMLVHGAYALLCRLLG